MERKQILELIEELKDKEGLVEYNGDFYTPEELMIHLTLLGQFEIVDNDEMSWFEKALNEEIQ